VSRPSEATLNPHSICLLYGYILALRRIEWVWGIVQDHPHARRLLDEVNAGVFDSSPHVDEIRSLLVTIWKCVLPDGKLGDAFEINLSACAPWAEKLLEGFGYMSILNYLYLRE